MLPACCCEGFGALTNSSNSSGHRFILGMRIAHERKRMYVRSRYACGVLPARQLGQRWDRARSSTLPVMVRRNDESQAYGVRHTDACHKAVTGVVEYVGSECDHSNAECVT